MVEAANRLWQQRLRCLARPSQPAAARVALWLAWWRSAEAHAAVLLCSGWRGGALQKRTPPCCCALAGVVALCRSARRRAVVLWLAWWRSAEAHAAVLLRSGWRGGALQKRTPPCCHALAGVVAPAEAHAAVLLCPGHCSALQKRTPPCCCALAGVVALCRSARRRAAVLWLAWWRSVEAPIPNFLVWAILLQNPKPKRRASPPFLSAPGLFGWPPSQTQGVFWPQRRYILASNHANPETWRRAPGALGPWLFRPPFGLDRGCFGRPPPQSQSFFWPQRKWFLARNHPRPTLGLAYNATCMVLIIRRCL